MPATESRTWMKLCTAAAAFLLLSVDGASAALTDLTPNGGAANSDDAVLLENLINGEVEGIVVGDKIFTGFSYSHLGDMPPSSGVNVLGFQDEHGNWGISLHGTFLDLPGDEQRSDALVRFTVEIDEAHQQLGWVINDAHLFLGGVGSGDDSFFGVDETFLLSNESMSVYRTTMGDGEEQVLSDWVDLEQPRTKLVVTKDIIAIAGANSGQPSRATVIDQAFSQTIIPEPAAVVLGALACVGTMALRRKHR